MTDFKHGVLLPIDKAPKDGTTVVIYHAMYIDANNTIRDKERPDFYAIAHWDGKTWKESFGDEYATYPEATHFQLLPTPPEDL